MKKFVYLWEIAAKVQSDMEIEKACITGLCLRLAEAYRGM